MTREKRLLCVKILNSVASLLVFAAAVSFTVGWFSDPKYDDNYGQILTWISDYDRLMPVFRGVGLIFVIAAAAMIVLSVAAWITQKAKTAAIFMVFVNLIALAVSDGLLTLAYVTAALYEDVFATVALFVGLAGIVLFIITTVFLVLYLLKDKHAAEKKTDEKAAKLPAAALE